MVASALFVALGVWIIVDGDRFGWMLAGFFGLTLLIAIFEPRLRRPPADSGYRIVISSDEIACEHRKRKRESIRWEDVHRIWYVTTSQGPWLPDEWILLEGASGGCSFPTEASGFNGFWGEVEQRFPGFDYKPLIEGGTTDARHLCWEREG